MIAVTFAVSVLCWKVLGLSLIWNALGVHGIYGLPEVHGQDAWRVSAALATVSLLSGSGAAASVR